jgi:LmbE family N-acetylglucosaminyl deacetylase
MIHWLWYTLPMLYWPGLERLLGGPCPPLRNSPAAKRILAVAAHPDDLEYFCGGTLHRLAREGAQVAVVIATQGDRGGDPEVRRMEQERAASILGYGRVHMLGFPDRRLQAADPQLLEALRVVLHHEAPDLLLTFDPDYPFPIYQHNDHMAVARAVLSLWQGDTLLFHTRRPNLGVDITASFAVKVAAFGAHQSQLPRRATAKLLGWHLARRNRLDGRRYIEVFRSLSQ